MFPSTCHLLIIYLCLLLLLLMSSNMFFSVMDPNKSLGPYGLNPAFYKKLWNLCGPNIFTATISWLENGSLPQQINQTSIVLIPKIPNPVTMKEFRPISLGNILYKIISKTLANRINPLLTKCISLEQSTFVEGCSILDNVFIAYEIIQHLKCKTRGKDVEVALKFDISKAFDKVQWNYLFRLMEKIGFNDIWIRWIKTCLETDQYSLRVNGVSFSQISPWRGLR